MEPNKACKQDFQRHNNKIQIKIRQESKGELNILMKQYVCKIVIENKDYQLIDSINKKGYHYWEFVDVLIDCWRKRR